MSRRQEEECAFCAELLDPESACLGDDRKVYCSPGCARAGEVLSRREHERIMEKVEGRP
ncbi:MAG: hypothetical protein ACOYNR_08100 [Blastocatellia bacterium]